MAERRKHRRTRPDESQLSLLPGTRQRPGRVESALDRDLKDSQVPTAGRAHLRACARALDVAERSGDLEATAKLARVYLEALQAFGMAGGAGDVLDPFAAFVAGLSTPTLGHPTDPEQS